MSQPEEIGLVKALVQFPKDRQEAFLYMFVGTNSNVKDGGSKCFKRGPWSS